MLSGSCCGRGGGGAGRGEEEAQSGLASRRRKVLESTAAAALCGVRGAPAAAAQALRAEPHPSLGCVCLRCGPAGRRHASQHSSIRCVLQRPVSIDPSCPSTLSRDGGGGRASRGARAPRAAQRLLLLLLLRGRAPCTVPPRTATAGSIGTHTRAMCADSRTCALATVLWRAAQDRAARAAPAPVAPAASVHLQPPPAAGWGPLRGPRTHRKGLEREENERRVCGKERGGMVCHGWQLLEKRGACALCCWSGCGGSARSGPQRGVPVPILLSTCILRRRGWRGGEEGGGEPALTHPTKADPVPCCSLAALAPPRLTHSVPHPMSHLTSYLDFYSHLILPTNSLYEFDLA